MSPSPTGVTQKASWWMSEHAVGCVTGEKCWVWVIFRLYSKPAYVKRHYLISPGCSLQTQSWGVPWAKSGQSFQFLAHTAGMCRVTRAHGGLPLPTNMCMTETHMLNMLGDYWFFPFYFIFENAVYGPQKWLHDLTCSNPHFKNQPNKQKSM